MIRHFVAENLGSSTAYGKLGLVYLCLGTNHLFALLLQTLQNFML